MKVIKCDHCDKVMSLDDERFMGTIQWGSNEEMGEVIFLVLESMDLCSGECLLAFIKQQLERLDEKVIRV